MQEGCVSPYWLNAAELSGSLPTPFPLSRQPKKFLSFLFVAGRAYWLDRGEGVGEEPNHTTARKPGPLQIIQYSLIESKQQSLKI